MDRDLYRKELRVLESMMTTFIDTPYIATSKVSALMAMNMRYEKIAFDRNLSVHPFVMTREIIQDAGVCFRHLAEASYISPPPPHTQKQNQVMPKGKSDILEMKHEELWQEIWSRHNAEEFREFIDLKRLRLKINDICALVEGKRCIDFGCGNGSFAIALLEEGASWVTGVDFGEKSVRYAQAVAESLMYSEQTEFKIADVLATCLPDESYDFAVSNGVFHHLRKAQMQLALNEVSRVLKKGGWFWYYIDGKDAISMDLWDTSVAILKDVDILHIENVLKSFNVGRNKMVHCMDGLSATYIHSTWDETVAQLREAGFDDFRRLQGGAPTDMDGENYTLDPYAKEKFGEGDLRILCRKI